MPVQSSTGGGKLAISSAVLLAVGLAGYYIYRKAEELE